MTLWWSQTFEQMTCTIVKARRDWNEEWDVSGGIVAKTIGAYFACRAIIPDKDRYYIIRFEYMLCA